MIGVVGSLIVFCVASIAIRRGPGEAPADVAGQAIQLGVATGQSESCEGMIELGTQPGIRAVAGLAGGCEAQLPVIQRLRAGILKFRQVAGDAVGAESRELTHCHAGMAGRALNRSMRPDQRKAVVVVFNRAH